MILLACGCAGSGSAETPEPPAFPDDVDAITLRMVQLARAGRFSEARESVIGYLGDHPDDGTMLYNLACLDLLLDDSEQALTDLESALAAGYTNFRLIDNDPSLNPLRDDPRFQDLVLGYETALRDTFQARALTLEDGYPQAGIPLRWERGSADGSDAPRAELQLNYDRDGLNVVVTAQDSGVRLDRLPWRGGSGLLVNLVRPISPDDYESKRYHSVGIGVEDGAPRAYLVGRDGDVALTPLPGIEPVVERRGDTTRYDVTIPWSVFHPYGPPLDLDMGLNVFYVGAGAAADRGVLSLMPEDRLSFEPDPWRRYVPVSFWTSDRTMPVMKGRLYDRMIEGETVDLEYVLWSTADGPGTCRVTVVGADGEPVAEIPPTVRELQCDEELNYFDESIELGELPTGAYALRMTVEGPDGIPMSLEESFSRFEKDWIRDLNVRIYEMENPESPILRYRLFVLARDLDRRHPQDATAGFHQAYRRIEAMVSTCEAGGSCLPDQGVFLGGFAVDTMVQRLCAMHLPHGYRELENPRLLVVVPPRPGIEMQLAGELGAALGDDDVIVLVPQSHGTTGLALATASRHTELAVAWARELFHTDDVWLAGAGAGADAALAVSLSRPDLFRGVMLSVDHLFLEDDRFSADHLREVLVGTDSTVPYTLVTGLIAGDRLAVIESAMRESGHRLDVVARPEGASDAAWIAAGVRGRAAP